MQVDDFSAITNLINMYAVAVDSHRYDLFERIFTDDIRCDFGGGAAFADRSTLTSTFRDIHAVFTATQHITSGHAITVNGDEANCLSYVFARFRREVDGSDSFFESTGWYDDVLIRQPQGWRIKDRISRMVSCGGNPKVMQAMAGVDTNYPLLSLSAEAAEGRIRFLGQT